MWIRNTFNSMIDFNTLEYLCVDFCDDGTECLLGVKKDSGKIVEIAKNVDCCDVLEMIGRGLNEGKAYIDISIELYEGNDYYDNTTI